MVAHVYKLAGGKRVPSVTTINKIGMPAEGLVHWAWELGMDGKDYRQVRDDAADAGSVGHKLVESAIRGDFDPPDLSRFDEDVQKSGYKAYEAYLEWREQSKIEWLHTEISLVSEEYRYGGTLDAIGRMPSGNGLCLGDWKTGRLYPDHLCQVRAYKELWDRQPAHMAPGVGMPIEGFHLCRFNRDTGDFVHAYFGDLEEAWEAFLLKRRLYDLLAKLKKRV